MGEPPVEVGAVQLTVAWALPRTALTLVGAPGGPSGVTLFDCAEAVPVPTLLMAATVNVYAVPLARPVTIWVVAVELNVVAVWAVAPMYGVTVYPVTGLPPFPTGAVQLTVACALPAVADTPVGASGSVAGGTALEIPADPTPTALVAVTWMVSVVPVVSLVTHAVGGVALTLS